MKTNHIIHTLFLLTLLAVGCLLTACVERNLYDSNYTLLMNDNEVVAPDSTESISQTGTLGGHGYVDLGLPSGLLWATMNVGASAPEDYGDYFAWGEIKAKSNYSWNTYSWCNGSENTLTKYDTSSSYGTVDNKTVLDPADDAACKNWGENWRIPTDEEWAELHERCIWTWTIRKGANVYKVTSKKNGNSIYLPAAGVCVGADQDYLGSAGFYWSSLLYTNRPSQAWIVGFESSTDMESGNCDRFCGLSVRPVSGENPSAPTFFLSTYEMTLFAPGGTDTIYVTSNQAWKVSENDEWLTLSPISGTGDATIIVKAEANTSVESRAGTLTFSVGDKTYRVSVMQNADEKEGEINGHAYVDLDLPSGLLWATMNVGATSPDDYGDYVAWGETKAKSNYTWDTYTWGNGFANTLTKYSDDSYYGTMDNMTVLDPSDDAAAVNWGDVWRMPTDEEWTELRENCSWTWTKLNYREGYMVTSKANGYSIFLPAAGHRYETDVEMRGSSGNYWSSSLDKGFPISARDVDFDESEVKRYTYYRYYGLSVRPVWDKNMIASTFSLSPDELIFVPTGGTETVSIKSNRSWTVLGGVEWITLSSTFGTGDATITVTAKANSSFESRTCTLSFSTGGKNYALSITQEGRQFDAAGRDYVDLGLPSGLLWATMNVGATSPDDYGFYFAWGETEPKSYYAWETYKWGDSSDNTLKKYNTTNLYGTIDDKTVLELEDDAASVNWGGSWRMPTSEEWLELINTDNCTWTWMSQNGIDGARVTSKTNSNYIFFPAAGYRTEGNLDAMGEYGMCWSSSLELSAPIQSLYFFYNSFGSAKGYANRHFGLSVRPVIQP